MLALGHNRLEEGAAVVARVLLLRRVVVPPHAVDVTFEGGEQAEALVALGGHAVVLGAPLARPIKENTLTGHVTSTRSTRTVGGGDWSLHLNMESCVNMGTGGY